MLHQANGNLYYNGTHKAYYGSAIPNMSVIDMLFDMDNGRLSFIVNGVNKGIAFESDDLKTGEYYLTYNCYHTNDVIAMIPPPGVK